MVSLQTLHRFTGLTSRRTILLSYIRFYYGLKKQGLLSTRKSFPYRAPYQPWFSFYGFFFFTIVIIVVSSGRPVLRASRLLTLNRTASPYSSRATGAPATSSRVHHSAHLCHLLGRVEDRQEDQDSPARRGQSLCLACQRFRTDRPLPQIDFTTGRLELDEMEARDQETYKEDKWYSKVSGILF